MMLAKFFIRVPKNKNPKSQGPIGHVLSPYERGNGFLYGSRGTQTWPIGPWDFGFLFLGTRMKNWDYS